MSKLLNGTKYTLHPRRYRIGEIEKYYSDMAAKGLHLVKRGVFLSKFTQGEAADMKYRVEVVYNNKNFSAYKMPEEQLAVYEDCGWQFVDSDAFIHIFRAPADSETEEFYLDPSQQAETLKGVKNNLIMSALQFPAQILLYTLLNILMGENITDVLYLSWIGETYNTLIFLTFIFLCMWGSIYVTIHISLLYRKLKKGIPLNHSPKVKSFGYKPVLPVLIVLTFGLTLYSFLKEDTFIPLDPSAPYITLYNLGYDESYIREEHSGHVTTGSPFGRYWETNESLKEGSGTKWIMGKMFILNNPEHSAKVAKALMNTSTFGQDAEEFTEISAPGLDKAYTAKNLEYVAVKDNKVVILTTTLGADIPTEKLFTALREKWENYK